VSLEKAKFPTLGSKLKSLLQAEKETKTPTKSKFRKVRINFIFFVKIVINCII
jgi:hypothetical protein